MTKRLELKNPGIFAIETIWSEYVNEPTSSVRHMFELIGSNQAFFNYTVLNSNTRGELLHSLDVAKKFSRKFRTLYFSTHGERGILKLSFFKDNDINLIELAEIMGKRFRNWAVHFGSCSTIGIDEDVIYDFMNKTEIIKLSGYERDVDWMDSAGMEVIYFARLCENYDNLKKMGKEWRDNFSELSDGLGFRIYLKGE